MHYALTPLTLQSQIPKGLKGLAQSENMSKIKVVKQFTIDVWISF